MKKIVKIEELDEFAQYVASNIARKNNVLALRGDLGAGKTTFTRALIGKLITEKQNIVSPTFTLLQIYDTPDFPIYHFDLYRLKNKSEIYELGIEDAFDFGFSIIEWPQIIESILPNNTIYIDISFTKNENEREFVVNQNS